ncbi:coiled-coil domain-containing protein [Parasphingopyxis marina]|uniref:ATPase n=1 Tax=Parasphingopyxis marina TaxID=2761622 RepID=A0A842HZ17_9SPHN|nr:hypothetical protein [Parasphingopyxis marina]MBC2777599.1 hypothetical protein [Parasphingopyxis marina]
MAEAANDIAELESGGNAARKQIETASARPEWLDEDEWAFALEKPGVAERLPVILIVLAALGWTGFVGWAAYSSIVARNPTLTEIANWIAIASVPLALLGIFWLMTQRTSRREAVRFGRTAEAMRTEARRLDTAMAIVSAQLSEIRENISTETDRLLVLSEEAAGRLGTIGEDVRNAGATIEEKSGLLDRAAKTARDNVQILMTDLPRAEEQARAVSGSLKEAGINAHEQAASLDTQLKSLKERGEEANDIASGAARALAANLTRIEGVAEIAANKLATKGEEINAAVEAALNRSSDAVEDTRKVVAEIGAALSAMIETARATFTAESEEAAAMLDGRLAATNDALTAFDAKLGEQRRATASVLSDLDKGLTGIEGRLAGLSENGAGHARKLGEELDGLRAGMSALGESIGGNDAATERLIARAAEVKAALDLSASSLSDTLPRAFADTESRTEQLKEAIRSVTPELETLQKLADDTRAYVVVSGESLDDQKEGITNFVDQVGDRISSMREDIAGFETALANSAEQANSIAEGAAPRLIETLAQVRETADQAAEKARAAFGELIPQSASALSEATRQAMSDALGENIEGRMAEIVTASERAITAAREAADQLEAKMAEIEERSTAIETRLEETQTEAEASSMDGFARRVTLLIESLNSTAIDVSKILSNEVTDTAWAAYLKGDRGVFSRRAVRLLDTGEAREIAAQYESNSEFREHVNRYIHDFESMLRRVLATRDGSPLAVTLLSSDNGKLYVSLAQAIERLRS